MRRWLVVLVFVSAVVVAAPRAWAGDAPIGRLGDTLRVDTGKVVADVTVSRVEPVDPPPDSVTPAAVFRSRVFPAARWLALR